MFLENFFDRFGSKGQKAYRTGVWLLRSLRHLFSLVPLLGPLVYCRVQDHKTSLKEFFFAFAFATAAFWLTAVFMKLGGVRGAPYLDVLASTISRGELFIFAIGFLGPVFLMTQEDPKDARAFPDRSWHTIFVVIICALAAGAHAMVKQAQLSPDYSLSDDDFLWDVSLLAAGAALVLRYLATVYRKSTFGPSNLKDEEKDFTAKYMQHRTTGGGEDGHK